MSFKLQFSRPYISFGVPTAHVRIYSVPLSRSSHTMSDHHHHEGCGHEAHGHDHDHGHDEEGSGGGLFSKIDLQNVTVKNSEQPGSNAIKPWHERLDDTVRRYVSATAAESHMRMQLAIESDADDQLIIRIPFTGSVKLRTILIRSGPESQTPSKICLVGFSSPSVSLQHVTKCSAVREQR